MRAPEGRAREFWALARVHVWPERYVLVSLPRDAVADAAALLVGAGFGALVRERDELSLTVREDLWRQSPLVARAGAEDGPYRALTLDVDVALDVTGFLAPAAVELAAHGVSIVPQCGYLKDHLLVREASLQSALGVLAGMIQAAQA